MPCFFHSLITNSTMSPLSRVDEMLLLLAVCRLGDKAYGITIRRQIEASVSTFIMHFKISSKEANDAPPFFCNQA